jgi:hypothetical protein
MARRVSLGVIYTVFQTASALWLHELIPLCFDRKTFVMTATI